MASQTSRLTFRVLLGILVILALYYVGRPLYWKISATVHDIRHNKQTVSGGFSQIVQEAQRSVGWFHDESDSGVHVDQKSAAARRLLCNEILTRTLSMAQSFVVQVQELQDNHFFFF
ncbi:PREDICTED: uncharacterized protein LOC109176218 isoform X1 [Ipomoea nil]|uniref:uncharacterized protein LOC109176218 isoform X1 n=1 Tax=Ipomoea nil TaxID=35883 RepID=UPI000900979F|nr:PREDICTED: uncharacterized protein LOC109176218 isoform X1 [Ipomoea nil]